jgi:hypothetical protein
MRLPTLVERALSYAVRFAPDAPANTRLHVVMNGQLPIRDGFAGL